LRVVVAQLVGNLSHLFVDLPLAAPPVSLHLGQSLQQVVVLSDAPLQAPRQQ